MQKDFDVWNELKKKTESKARPIIKVGQVFWCRFGINLGSEFDGKNQNFLRPVVIIKKYSNEVVFVLPLTTKIHKGDWYFDIKINDIKGQIILNQGKTIDVKRLEDQIETLPSNKVKEIIKSFILLLESS